MVSLLACFMVGCEKDYNNWDVEPGGNRLFKPIVLEVSGIEPTAVELKFTKGISATKYIFEFSKDSLQFNEIVKTVEVLADTITPFAESTNQVKEEYRETFSELDGTTGYSVRMKSVNEDTNMQSNYNQVYFETPAEQIFTSYTPTTNSVALVWTITPRVTHISLYDEMMEPIEDYNLTDEQKSLGELTIDGLEKGTNYIVKIFNGDNNRGTLGVLTTGIPDSYVYNALPTDNASSIAQALKDIVAGGTADITVEFESGQDYSIGGDLRIPSGINNIAFVGSADGTGKLSTLDNARFRFEGQINDLTIQYLSTTSSGSFFVETGGHAINDITIVGCDVSNINSIVRVNGDSVVNDINVSNCWISQTGGWGMLNVGSGNTVNSINVSNCTLTEISTRFADIRISTNINFKNITCVNINLSMGHIWRFDNNHPVQVSIQDCIIAGPNGGSEINDTNGNYSNITISYTGSYKTNDLMIKDRPLNGITEIPLDIYGLFIDPDNGDFHIQEGIGFAGTGVAGDTRWFD